MALPFDLVDAWINPNLAPPSNASHNVGYLFPELAELWARGTTLEQLVEEMDAGGVTRGVLCAGYGDVDDIPWVSNAIETYPDRFVGSIVVDPRTGMEAVRLVERLSKEGYRMVRMLAFNVQLPYNDAAYFPVFSKCAELGLPVGLNVGIPGPLVPGKHQHPLSLDDVCAFFPELTVVMQHGGEPWAELCVKLMLKWENLHYMSSAFAPRHIPAPIIHYANTRGADKVMWASDYPLLGFERCASEIELMPFRDEDRRLKFGRDNASKLFFA